MVRIRSESGPGDDNGEDLLPPPGVTVVVTAIPPTPEAGDPTATVIATSGVNLRTGPGLIILLSAPPPTVQLWKWLVSGKTTWWVVNVPGAPNNYGWVAEEFVDVQDGENVIVIALPPTPTPAATATATATPGPDISFSADRTVINAGESATLSWSVDNIKAVYVYPVGDNFYIIRPSGKTAAKCSLSSPPPMNCWLSILTIPPANRGSKSQWSAADDWAVAAAKLSLHEQRPDESPTRHRNHGSLWNRWQLERLGRLQFLYWWLYSYDQTLRTSDLTASR